MKGIFDPVNKISLKFKVIYQVDKSMKVLFEIFKVNNQNALEGEILSFFLGVDDFDYLNYCYSNNLIPPEGLPFTRGKDGNAKGIKFTVSHGTSKPGHMTVTIAKGTGTPNTNGFTKFEQTTGRLMINISLEQCVKMMCSINREILLVSLKND